MSIREKHLGEHGEAGLRHLAADLIIEATERGDLDNATVTWAVGRMLFVAEAAEHTRKRRLREAREAESDRP